MARNNRKLFFHGSGGQESKVKVLARLHSVWEIPFLASPSFQWLPVFLGLWLHHSHLCGHTAFSSSVCEQISLCLPLTDTLVIEFTAHPENPELSPLLKILNVVTLTKILFCPIRQHSLRFQELECGALEGWVTFFSLPHPAMKLFSIFYAGHRV